MVGSTPPVGNGRSWAYIEPVVPPQRPRTLGENQVADSEDTRTRTAEAKREADGRLRNEVQAHRIQRELAAKADKECGVPSTTRRSNSEMSFREFLFWAIAAVLTFFCIVC